MTSPLKPWEHKLQNSTHILKNPNSSSMSYTPQNGARSAPPLPPLPRSPGFNSPYNSYMPYSNGLGYGGGYGSYGSYGSYNMPYRSSLYGGYGGYSDYGGYTMDDTERRFIQYAEERSRNAFANVESIVRVFSSISMMLDNTFFAMTSSFRAVLSVAENFGKLRNMFGQIWHSVNLFRFFNYLYRKFMWLMGRRVPNSAASLAWSQAMGINNNNKCSTGGVGSSWTAFAFLGVLFSAPYIISKFLPKYEDKSDSSTWKSAGVKAKAAFDFTGRASNELSVQVNDEITLAPTYIQEEMNLKNTGWAFAVSSNGKSGVVPLNYLVLVKKSVDPIIREELPVPRTDNHPQKTHTKRVSFGENQIFENFDLEDYISGKKETKLTKKADDGNNNNNNEEESTTVKVDTIDD